MLKELVSYLLNTKHWNSVKKKIIESPQKKECAPKKNELEPDGINHIFAILVLLKGGREQGFSELFGDIYIFFSHFFVCSK